ncbi:MAG: YicC/YloC family endoribonuclease [Ruthenibacterium sp.]
MVRSMTGYGRAEQVLGARDITVEIKSVNSRYFEYTSRMPRSVAFVDDKLKKLLNETISRGKVELGLTIQSIGAGDGTVAVNMEVAKSYFAALAALSETLHIKNDITASGLAHFPDVITMQKTEQDEDELWQEIKTVATQAAENFVAMRAVEGEKLKADITSRLAFLETAVAEIEQTSEMRVQKYTEKMTAKLQVILSDTQIDESRILTEAAIFADKTAVDEETVRLQSHIKQYRDILEKNEPVGRKLDFLTQELNREVNTIGSKCNEISITRMVVDMKAEIEKIREQIQNIE